MSRPAPSSVLIAGYYGYGNAGDEAILAALLADLRTARPDLAVTVVSGDPARTLEEHGVQGAVADRDIPALVEAVRASGLVVVGGGGLFQSYWEVDPGVLLTARHGGLPSYLGPAVLGAWLDKPVVICGVGVGPLPNESGREGTRVAFEIARRATVRDPESLALLGEIGLPAPAAERVELTADPAFRLAPAAPDQVDRRLAELGVRPGKPLCAVALRYWDFEADPAVWEGEVARGLDLFLEEFPGRLLFLPFQQAAGRYEDDVAVHRRVAAALTRAERAAVVDRVLPPAELAGLLGRCERALAMRFHAALFALAAGVPVANLAYDPKTRTLMEQAGV
ncbi:MAG TPA: polysaccharide pyruvyl transferase family protein, partial [Thermoanaerobaculia bacterium]|nr:polysaccharide pyruvyl transferase family protein [Thermoanaerobaculia bacterium]